MGDYEQTRDAAGSVTSQYDKMLRNLDDDLVKQALAELGDVVRCRCSEAYTVCGRRDPDCQCDSAEAVKVVAERIQKLEAKLEALDHAYDHLVQALRFEALRTDDAEAKLAECEARLEKAVELAFDECPFRDGTGSYNEWWHYRRKELEDLRGQNDK